MPGLRPDMRQAMDFEGGARNGGTRCTTGCTAPAGCVNGERSDERHLTSRILRVWGRVAKTQDGSEHRGEETHPGRNGRTTHRYGTRKPQEWRRSRRPSGDGGANRRGGTEPRGRTVPGEANPGDTDPAAHVAGGAGNPRRGSQDHRNGPDRRCGSNPERAAKPEGDVRTVTPEPVARLKTPRSCHSARRSRSPQNQCAARSGGEELREAAKP